MVPAGVPSRTPEVTVGFSGSNGMPFLLQVMCARPSACLGDVAGELLRPQVDQHQMRVGAARDEVEAALDSASPSALALSTTRWRRP